MEMERVTSDVYEFLSLIYYQFETVTITDTDPNRLIEIDANYQVKKISIEQNSGLNH